MTDDSQNKKLVGLLAKAVYALAGALVMVLVNLLVPMLRGHEARPAQFESSIEQRLTTIEQHVTKVDDKVTVLAGEVSGVKADVANVKDSNRRIEDKLDGHISGRGK